MHVTMLIAGLIFWWRIFDLRPAPAGWRNGTRLTMLLFVMLSNIGLGAFTTLKSVLLYPAYDIVGRLFDISPLTDEMTGGFMIWMPSSMMSVLAVLIVIHRWGRTGNARRREAHDVARPCRALSSDRGRDGGPDAFG